MKFALAAILAVTSHALQIEQNDVNCKNVWVYEECSDRHWLACDARDVTDCGWWYKTDDEGEEWVTCDDWESWESC